MIIGNQIEHISSVLFFTTKHNEYIGITMLHTLNYVDTKKNFAVHMNLSQASIKPTSHEFRLIDYALLMHAQKSDVKQLGIT